MSGIEIVQGVALYALMVAPVLVWAMWHDYVLARAERERLEIEAELAELELLGAVGFYATAEGKPLFVAMNEAHARLASLK